MGGLLQKSLREVWVATLLTCTALLGANMLLTFLIPKVQQGVGEMFDKLPFARQMMSALLGTEIGDQIAAQTMAAVLWVHPIVLALVWAHAINLSTRMPAGEIDRGTIDFLLGLPVSRRWAYWSAVLMLMLTTVLLIGTGYVGHRLAAPLMPQAMRPDAASSAWIMANMYCLTMAVAGIGFLVSACSNRRSVAISVVFAVVLGSFLLNFAAQLWPPAASVSFLGVLEYYRPAVVLESREAPLGDIATLLAIAAATLAIGCEITARRSIATT